MATRVTLGGYRRAVTASGVNVASGGGALSTSARSGVWYAPGIASGTFAIANGEMYASQLHVPKATTIVELAFEVVTTAGGAGAVVRPGIYADDGDSYPGALLLDCGLFTGGLVPATTTGVKNYVLDGAGGRPPPLAVAPGRYWLVAPSQGAPTPTPTLRLNNWIAPNPLGAQTAASALSGGVGSYFQASITGALPSTFTTSMFAATLSPRVAVKFG